MSGDRSPPSLEGPLEAVPVVEVFWRPGCPYCTRLRGVLLVHGVEATWRNIWEDSQAGQIVRAANNGNETVPTVRVDGTTLTNPSWRQLASVLGRDARAEPRPPRRRPYASPGACSPAPNDGFSMAGLAMVAVLLMCALIVAALGRGTLTAVLVLAALAAWIWTRAGERARERRPPPGDGR